MRKWPLNSITLVAAIHRKLEKAANGTSTQVATCMINKWRAKINGNEVYNVRNPPGMGDQKIDKENTVAVCIMLESFCNQALENQEEEPVLGSSPRIKFHTSPHVFVIQSTYNHVQLLRSSLKPSSWTHSLQIYCIRLVGLESTYLTAEVIKPCPYNHNIKSHIFSSKKKKKIPYINTNKIKRTSCFTELLLVFSNCGNLRCVGLLGNS